MDLSKVTGRSLFELPARPVPPAFQQLVVAGGGTDRLAERLWHDGITAEGAATLLSVPVTDVGEGRFGRQRLFIELLARAIEAGGLSPEQVRANVAQLRSAVVLRPDDVARETILGVGALVEGMVLDPAGTLGALAQGVAQLPGAALNLVIELPAATVHLAHVPGGQQRGGDESTRRIFNSSKRPWSSPSPSSPTHRSGAPCSTTPTVQVSTRTCAQVGPTLHPPVTTPPMVLRVPENFEPQTTDFQITRMEVRDALDNVLHYDKGAVAPTGCAG